MPRRQVKIQSLEGRVFKTEMVKAVSKDTGISKEAVGFMYDSLMAMARKYLAEIRPVVLPGIGIFYHNPSKARMSNLTQEMIPPHKHLSFKPQEELAKEIRVKTRAYKIR